MSNAWRALAARKVVNSNAFSRRSLVNSSSDNPRMNRLTDLRICELVDGFAEGAPWTPTAVPRVG